MIYSAALLASSGSAAKREKGKREKKRKRDMAKKIVFTQGRRVLFDNTGPELRYIPLSALAQLWRSGRSRSIVASAAVYLMLMIQVKMINKIIIKKSMFLQFS